MISEEIEDSTNMLYDETRAQSAELKKRQVSGGDWFKMDQKPETKEAKKFDLESHSARTKTPLPGQRDSDLNTSSLPSARHAVKDEYSDYVKLAKSGGHQGLLKIDGGGSEQNGEVRPRSRINDTDSEYVRMAKTGGHANLLKMDGVAEEVPAQKKVIKEHDSTYVKMAKSGGHSGLLKTDGVQVVESPRKNQIKETDSDYIKLAKKGGHSDLLKAEVAKVENSVKKVKIKDTDSDYVKLAKAGGHSNLLASESTIPKSEQAYPRRKSPSTSDSEYVKLAKRGGDSNLLKMADNAPQPKPISTSPRYKGNSSDWFQHNDKRTPEPIVTGKGRGVRKDTNNNNKSAILPSGEAQVQKSGKRLFQVQSDRAPPFALHF